MGLIGFGAIGQAVAERLRPFGATVRYSARHQRAAELEARLAVQHVGLEELLRVSSIVSLHLPLTEQTRGLLGAAALARMPQGAYLINTARGELVDEVARHRALVAGHLGGAALDVLQVEGEGGNPFADLPNVIVTPTSAAPAAVPSHSSWRRRRPAGDVRPAADVG